MAVSRLCLAVLSACLACAAAGPWAVGVYPHVQKSPEACGRQAGSSLLCDPDGLLTAQEADQVQPPARNQRMHACRNALRLLLQA